MSCKINNPFAKSVFFRCAAGPLPKRQASLASALEKTIAFPRNFASKSAKIGGIAGAGVGGLLGGACGVALTLPLFPLIIVFPELVEPPLVLGAGVGAFAGGAVGAVGAGSVGLFGPTVATLYVARAMKNQLQSDKLAIEKKFS